MQEDKIHRFLQNGIIEYHKGSIKQNTDDRLETEVLFGSGKIKCSADIVMRLNYKTSIREVKPFIHNLGLTIRQEK